MSKETIKGMGVLDVTLKGVTPLIMRNCRMADTLDVYAMALKVISSMRKKVEANYEAMSRVEWEGGLYIDGGVIVAPGNALLQTLRNGAKASKRGNDILKYVQMSTNSYPLVYDGKIIKDIPTPKRDGKISIPMMCLDEMFYSGEYHDRSMVKVGNAMVARTRPKFDNWEVAVTFWYVQEKIEENYILTTLADAGRYVGFLECRPMYGKFIVLHNGKEVE